MSLESIQFCVTAKRVTELNQLITDLNPPMFRLSSLVITRFLDGSYQMWIDGFMQSKDSIFQNVGKTGLFDDVYSC